MDFVQQPEDAKKFGSIKWLKWNLFKNPTVFIVFSPLPFILINMFTTMRRLNREMYEGKYVPYAVMNRYAICRSDDWKARTTPARYRN